MPEPLLDFSIRSHHLFLKFECKRTAKGGWGEDRADHRTYLGVGKRNLNDSAILLGGCPLA